MILGKNKTVDDETFTMQLDGPNQYSIRVSRQFQANDKTFKASAGIRYIGTGSYEFSYLTNVAGVYALQCFSLTGAIKGSPFAVRASGRRHDTTRHDTKASPCVAVHAHATHGSGQAAHRTPRSSVLADLSPRVPPLATLRPPPPPNTHALPHLEGLRV